MKQYFLKFAFYCSLTIILALFSSCGDAGESNRDPSVWTPSKAQIKEFKNLRELDLSDKDIVSLSSKIGDFQNLEKLYLQGNKLTELPQEMSKLSKVRKLNLAKNEFTKFPEIVLRMEGIKELDIRHNPISELPEAIKDMKRLHTIYIKGTELDKEDRKLLRKWLPKVKVIGR